MRLQNSIASLVLLLASLMPCILAQQDFNRSSKRGLIYITPQDGDTKDAYNWVTGTSDLTWYYNYGPSPTPFFNNDSSFEFVPMFFSPATLDFASTITNLTKAGTNITHVLTYNEPDGSTASGGSNVKPSDAAAAWILQVEPLRKQGIKLGAPAVTNAQEGFTWLQDFFDACDGGCTADFMTVHWYGDFPGLASHIGQKRAAYPNLTLWITEYALPNAALNDTQYFFNQSAAYFDRLGYVDRYSYFGSFRSSVSNVGADVAMLDQEGRLTDIGSWYLGGKATGNVPSAAGRIRVGIWTTVSVAVGVWLVL